MHLLYGGFPASVVLSASKSKGGLEARDNACTEYLPTLSKAPGTHITGGTDEVCIEDWVVEFVPPALLIRF